MNHFLSLNLLFPRIQFIALVLVTVHPTLVRAHGPHSYDTLDQYQFQTVDLESRYPVETRIFSVHLPLSYNSAPDTRYPVLYLLDADRPFVFQETINIVDILVDRHKIPELILVFLPNDSDETRNRDYTPSMKADQFLDFVEKQLIPYIDGEYRTHSQKLIAGHSRSGLLVTYAMLARPQIFDAHIALSPAYWHDDDQIVDQASTAFESLTSFPEFLYANVGGQENENISNAFDRMRFVLGRSAPDDFEFQLEYAEFETHGTTRPLGLYLGLRKFFIDWDKQFE